MTTASKRHAAIEPLEVRRLLAAAAGAVLTPDGTLTITGTPGNDMISLPAFSPGGDVNGHPFNFENQRDLVKRVVVKALGGDDQIEVGEDFMDGVPITTDGGAGNDDFMFFDQRPRVIGGAGNDVVHLWGLTEIVSFEDSGGIDTLDMESSAFHGTAYTLDMRLYPGLDNVIKASLNVIGNGLDNTFQLYAPQDGDTLLTVKGGSGNDTLISDGPVIFEGEAGNDAFVNASSNYQFEDIADTFIGGSGNDTIDYSARFMPLYVDLKSNPGIGGEFGENDSLIGVENALGTAILDGAGHLTITGTAGDDDIQIRYGDDAYVNGAEFNFPYDAVKDGTVKSLGGNDVVYFIDLVKFVADLGAGNDVLELYDSDGGAIGGPGNDVVRPHFRGTYDSFDGGPGIDTIDIQYSDFDVFHNVYLPSMPTVENVLGSRSDVTGNGLNNYITLFNVGSNNELIGQYVSGGGGNDTVVGSDSPLYFDGGSGDDVASHFDTFVGGTGSDTVDLSTATVPVLIDLSQGIVRIDRNETGPQFAGVENAIGGSGDDTLIGDGNRNVLNGGAGNDTITGNGGKDVLLGGEGNDLFLARDGKRDVVIGGDGIDSGVLDRKDWRSEVEILLA